MHEDLIKNFKIRKKIAIICNDVEELQLHFANMPSVLLGDLVVQTNYKSSAELITQDGLQVFFYTKNHQFVGHRYDEVINLTGNPFFDQLATKSTQEF